MEYRNFESSPNIKKAFEIAKNAHKRQVDKAGKEYIYHPMAVASFVPDDENCIIVALLHDVVEDTDVTLEDLKGEFSPEVLNALICMTHEKDEPYSEYILRVNKNDIAKEVKLADLKHNMDLTRLPSKTEIDFKRLAIKYTPAMEFLIGDITEKEYLIKVASNTDNPWK